MIDLYKSIQKNDSNFYNALNEINKNWLLLSKIAEEDSEIFVQLYRSYSNNNIKELALMDKISEYLLVNSEKFNGMFHTQYNFYIEEFVKRLSNGLFKKILRMKKIECESTTLSEEDIIKNIESGMKGAFYTHYRYLMNNKKKLETSVGFNSAVFLFIREMCYSSMFRYNANGEFNVPYGGISYNNKKVNSKIDYYLSEDVQKRLKNTVIECDGFYSFMKKYPPKKNDFIFIDPPYDTEFSTYANNSFDVSDQQRLANYLINECMGNFMVVIKETKLISELYNPGLLCKNGNELKVSAFVKKYAVSIENRNNKECKHLIITNY